MILVDTPVWVDHLRAGDDMLAMLLEQEQVLMHPFVRGEIALGHLRDRNATLQALDDMRQATVAEDFEVHRFIERAKLFGSGIGYVDAHLLASASLMDGVTLLTRDRRLHKAAEMLAVAARILN